MASPRVFVSSTCYDLNEVRDNLYNFITTLGYIPVFSDKNDVFYHPDLHSHESCLKEIENCQIFILIIGGRFGGNYVYDDEKSIVNAEFETAKRLNIPIFSFVKKEVNDDHKVFTRNRKEKPDIFEKIDYPSIEKQNTALKIFNFIDDVRKSNYNNAYFTFEFSREIKEILKKQFAGMFFDFLWNRKNEKELEKNNELLTNLSLLGQKTEEIIENIYKKIDSKSAETEIKKLDIILNASKFWHEIIRSFKLSAPKGEERIEELSNFDSSISWIDFLTTFGNFNINEYNNSNFKVKGLVRKDGDLYLPLESSNGEISEYHKSLSENLERYFNDYKSLSVEERINILKKL